MVVAMEAIWTKKAILLENHSNICTYKAKKPNPSLNLYAYLDDRIVAIKFKSFLSDNYYP